MRDLIGGGPAAALNAGRRAAEIGRLAEGEGVDVVVIGGGITGAGVALDAASRGLRVALVERRDLANGTSRWSSKLAHGGLRYLRHDAIDVAWESARERDILMTRTAPHLVRPLEFVTPLDSVMSRAMSVFTAGGIVAGDVLRMAAGTPSSLLPHPRRIGRDEALRRMPSLSTRKLRGALSFWDGRLEDDARLVIAIARTAAAHGAMVLTYCEAVQATRTQVRVRDALTGAGFDIRTAHTVNATGVWAGSLAPGVHLRPSKGSHVLVHSALLGDPAAALIVPVPGESARWVGATPAGDNLTIIGTSDDEYDGPLLDEPEVSDAEALALLDVVSLALDAPLGLEDVIGRYAGFRPLVSGVGGSTADLSRRHAILTDAETGVVSVVGGKLTTYRHMAEETVDRTLGAAAPPCRTERLPLIGAAPPRLLPAVPAPERLVRRYGLEARVVAALANRDRRLIHPIAPDVPALGVELLFGIEQEGALMVDDLLDRRVRLGLVPQQRRAAELAAQSLLHGGVIP